MGQKPYTQKHAALTAASGLFDRKHYLAANPDVAKAGLDPFDHFLGWGGFEGRDPNAYFSIASYVKERPEVGWSGLNPLVHFLKHGLNDERPFHNFDPVWYRATYSECCNGGQHPLGHYLHGGRENGCLRHSNDVFGPRQNVEMRMLVSPPLRSETVLFVTHAPEGRIKPHVPRFLDSFRDAGLSVIVVVAADDLDQVEQGSIAQHCDGLILRKNGGYDFAAWAHAADFVDLSATKLLFIANDSIVGPLDNTAFCKLLDRVRSSSADLIGMTDNYELNYHFQSFLFAVKGAGVTRLLDFFSTVDQLHTKQQVIMTYEVRLFDRLKALGTSNEILFPCGIIRTNRTLSYWYELIQEGFPFVKMEVLRREPRDNWAGIFNARNFPVEIVDESIRIANLAGKVPMTRNRSRLMGTPADAKYIFYRFMEAVVRPLANRKADRYAAKADRRKKYSTGE